MMIYNRLRKMITKLVALSIAMTLFISCFGTGKEVVANEEQPLFTLACLSDLHNQGPIITEDNHAIRGTIDATVDKMLEEEKVDAVVIGGDVSSDHTTTSDKLYRILDMVQERMLELTNKTLWIVGNHDYNAGGSLYNSADYYNRYVEPSMGSVKESSDIYIENYNGIDYVCGYHYEINGFDVICLSSSYEILEGEKQHSNYAYSEGTFDWLDDTLYRLDENKLVFVIGHFPLGGSNNLSAPNKAMIGSSDTRMKETLGAYNNVFYLYGHDHAKDTAYIRTDTSERVTEYDSKGNVLNPHRHEENLGAEESDELVMPESVLWKFESSDEGYIIKNVNNNKYLNVGTNLTTSDEAALWNVKEENGSFAITKADSSEGNGVYYSTNSGTYSYGAGGNHSLIKLYRKTMVDGVANYLLADGGMEDIDSESEYILVANDNKALSHKNIDYQSANDRMLAVEVSKTQINGSEAIELPENIISDNENSDDTPDEIVPTGERKFSTVFMGSMRYYDNSIDGWVHENDSKVVQALMVYVYKDRVEFHMKNYGVENAGEEILKPYVVPMSIVPETTGTPSPGNSQVNLPNQGNSEAVKDNIVNNVVQDTNASDSSNFVKTKIKKAIIKSVSRKKNKAVVKIKKQNKVSGYKLLLSVNKKFRKKDTKTIYSKKPSFIIKKLKKGKKYYIKICAYKKVGGKKVYGTFSKIKKI